MLKKFDELIILVSNLSPDCVAITETWLTNLTSDDVLQIPNYDLFRNDRFGRIGGGVCLFIRNSFKPLRINQPHQNDFDFVSVRLSMNVVVCCFYIPPNLPVSSHRSINDFCDKMHDSILETFPRTSFILCGDFNDFDSLYFKENYCFKNHVKSPTRGDSLLDQIWLSEDLESKYPVDAQIGPSLSSSDHNCVYLKPLILSKPSASLRSIKTVYDLRQSNIQRYMNCLSQQDFSKVYNASGVDGKCVALYKAIYNAISVIPSKQVYMSYRDKPWITPVIKKLINDRWNAYRRKHWPLYNHLKSKVKNEILKAKAAWSNKVIRKEGNIWSVVSELKGKRKNSTLQTLDLQSPSFLNDLTHFFQSCFSQEADINLPSLSDEEWSINIDEFDVHQQLTKLKSKQAPGFDHLNARLLKEGAIFLAEPVAHIFRSSIEMKTFPELWKNALVCPVPKKTNPTVTDFRQISLLPILAKIFEKLVLVAMKSVLLQHYGRNQHAFRPNGSSTSAAIDIHNFALDCLDRRGNEGVRITCLDFSKAFDRIHHNRLLAVLKECGMNQGFLRWLHSYLDNRMQRISINAKLGPVIRVSSGVPQGSVLGPYLFAVFIGTLTINHDESKLVKFADDVTLIEGFFKRSAPPSNMETIWRWTDEFKLRLNLKKCHQLMIHRGKTQRVTAYPRIQVVPTATILGFTFNDKLNWNEHFDRVTLTASRRLHLLRTLKPHLHSDQLVMVYNACIMSVLTYGSPLFCNISARNLAKMERVRKRSHRIICSVDCQCSRLPVLQDFRKKVALKFLRKCHLVNHPLNHLVPKQFFHSQRYRLPHCNTTRLLNSFFPFTCSLYNSL